MMDTETHAVSADLPISNAIDVLVDEGVTGIPCFECNSAEVSSRWREFAEISALPENQPRMMHYDGHGRRIDRILRPRETQLMESEIFADGIFADRTPRWERLAKLLLLHQNGEAGVMCAMACTEGLIAITEAHLQTACEEVRKIWQHCKEGIDGAFGLARSSSRRSRAGRTCPLISSRRC